MELLNLKKGDLLNLSKKEPGLKNMKICAGWDVNDSVVKNSILRLFSGIETNYDLDLAHYLVDENGKVIKTVAYFNKEASGIRLHGDNLTGEGDGDDEIVSLNLDKLPSNCVKVVSAVVIYAARSRRHHFEKVKNAFVRIVNEDTGKEICRYNLTENGGENTAVIVSEIFKDKGEWSFRPIEKYSQDTIDSLEKRL